MKTTLHHRGPWVLAALTLMGMILAWMWLSQGEQTVEHARFLQDAAKAETLLEARLHAYEDILRNADTFLSNQKMTDSLWRRYAASLHLDQSYPMITGLGYAAYFKEEDRDPDLEITPPGKRLDYFVVDQIEPRQSHEDLLGFDLGSVLPARMAAEHARDVHGAGLSGQILLPDDTIHPQVLIFWPVVRQDILKGFFFVQMPAAALLQDLPMEAASLAAVQIYDGPAMSKETLFFDSANPLTAWQKPNDAPQTIAKSYTAFGHPWTLTISPKALATTSPRVPWNEALLIVLLGMLGFISAAFWSWSQRRAGKLAHEMMMDVRTREIALASGPNGVIIADALAPDYPVIFVNRAFEKITGYSVYEVQGKNCRFLEGTDRDQKGLQDLRRAMKEQRETRVLLRNYRKDGTPFWNDLYLTPIKNDMGKVVQWAAVIHDVTEREQTLRRLATEAAVIRALAESPSLYEAAPRILSAICEAQEWDVGTFWRVDPRHNALQCVDQWHSAELNLGEFDRFNRETTFMRDVGVPGFVWSKKEPVWLSDIVKDGRFPEAALTAKAGISSACGFPIANRKGLQGVLVFYSRRIWPLSKNLLLLMVGAGTQLSQYMEREETETQQKELTLLERGLAEFMGEGLVAMDREGFCIYANVMAGRLLGHAPRSILGQNLHEVLHPSTGTSHCDGTQCPVVLSLHSTKAITVDDPRAIFMRKGREPLPVSYITSPIINKDLIQGVVITFTDATARRTDEAKLRKALDEKDNEIKQIQDKLAQQYNIINQAKDHTSASDDVLNKIRKLLG